MHTHARTLPHSTPGPKPLTDILVGHLNIRRWCLSTRRIPDSPGYPLQHCLAAKIADVRDKFAALVPGPVLARMHVSPSPTPHYRLRCRFGVCERTPDGNPNLSLSLIV